MSRHTNSLARKKNPSGSKTIEVKSRSKPSDPKWWTFHDTILPGRFIGTGREDVKGVFPEFFSFRVDFEMSRIIRIITDGVRSFISIVSSSGEIRKLNTDEVEVSLRGGAVLALLKKSSGSVFQDLSLEINDLDYHIECSPERMNIMMEVSRTFKTCASSKITVPLGADSLMEFDIIQVVNFDNERSPGLIRLETRIDGRVWKIDIANSFGDDQIDYYANSIPIVYNRLYSQGQLQINITQLKSLVCLATGKPQPCVILEKSIKHFTRDHDSLERLVTSFSRAIKADAKGYVTCSIDNFQSGCEETCPICMTSHKKDESTQDSDEDTDFDNDNDKDDDHVKDDVKDDSSPSKLHALGLKMACGHRICGMCYYMMREKFCHVESYDTRCPLCREDIQFSNGGWHQVDIPQVAKETERLFPEWFGFHGNRYDFREKILRDDYYKRSREHAAPTLLQSLWGSIRKEYPDDERPRHVRHEYDWVRGSEEERGGGGGGGNVRDGRGGGNVRGSRGGRGGGRDVS